MKIVMLGLGPLHDAGTPEPIASQPRVVRVSTERSSPPPALLFRGLALLSGVVSALAALQCELAN